jgi:hypothetical protein
MLSTRNQHCTATRANFDKTCTVIAKTTPYLSCTVTMNCSKPGLCPVLRRVTPTKLYRRAVMFKP